MKRNGQHNKELPLIVMSAGNVGTEKTMLVNLAAMRFGWKGHFETATQSNPWLDECFKAMNASMPVKEISPLAYLTQAYFLEHRAYAFERAVSETREQVMMLDHCTPFEEVEVYSQNLVDTAALSTEAWKQFLGVYQRRYRNTLPTPDLLIYLYTSSVDILLKRVKNRGRREEQELNRKYLDRLDGLYAKMVSRFSSGRVISLCSDEFDAAYPATFDTALTIIGSNVTELLRRHT